MHDAIEEFKRLVVEREVTAIRVDFFPDPMSRHFTTGASYCLYVVGLLVCSLYPASITAFFSNLLNPVVSYF